MSNMDQKQLIEKKSQSLVPFEQFESYLKNLGLPSEGIIASDRERNMMARVLPDTIENLNPDLKRDAVYLSKFVASAAIGLYDASLNYLWNEVVLSLREKVKLYGLDLFFDAAVGGDVRENYSNEEDLVLIKDNTLIDSCRKLEIISDVLHEKLKHILYMRNHIGASHPNTEGIRTLELLGWLETCVNDIIADRPSEGAIFVQQLIINIKKEDLYIDDARIEQIKDTLSKQHTRISGNLLLTLFSIFTRKNTPQAVRGNILKLAPVVWDLSADNKKYEIGFKIDQFGLNLDEESAILGESFIEKCNGTSFKTTSAKIRELNGLLNRLFRTHNSWDNFHYEVSIARDIKKYIVTESDILPNIEDKLIKCILICRIGNGVYYNNGVSPGAKPYYDEIIQLFNSKQIKKLMRFFNEPEIRNSLGSNIKISQLIEVLYLINLDLQEDRTAEAIEYIIGNIREKGYSIFKTKELISYYKTL
ncbi:hypothetical protein [Lysinibacillus fusiformis]|uniref:hypothetical protein n=1 Tax=Lysinibacillus fusiformis TaxID=28031 RepID=UPI0034E292D6